MAKRPQVQIQPHSQKRYVDRLAQSLMRARLNRFYPSSRVLRDYVRALCPSFHHGFYDAFSIYEQTGLPVYADWVRVWSDWQLAQESSQEDKMSPQRAAYYQALKALRLHGLDRMDVSLRRIEPEKSAAAFHVTFDKLDARGVFIRISILLRQQDSYWRKNLVSLEAEASNPTDIFRTEIYRLAGLGALAVFLKLQALPNIEVEAVYRGTVGPIFWPSSSFSGAPNGALGPNDFLATFALESVGACKGKHLNNDPMLNETAPMTAQIPQSYDRKFVCTANSEPWLSQWLATCGTKNLIYTL